MADGNRFVPTPEYKRRLQALNALRHGKLDALAAYIRAGHSVEGELAECLADMIEGNKTEDFKLKTVGRKKNIRTREREIDESYRKLEIGAWTHVWIEGHPRGLAQTIRHNAAEEFGVGEAFVRISLAYFRQHLAFIEGEIDDIKGAPRDFIDLAFAKAALWYAQKSLSEIRD